MSIDIYSLSDPISNEIRYIGKSVDAKRRFYNHIKMAKSGDKRHISNWINKLLKDGKRPVLNIIERCNNDNWIEREMFWISNYKHLNLCNHSNGGEGAGIGHKNCVGRKYSQETIEKMKTSHLNRFKKITPELRIKMSEIASSRILSKNGNAKKCINVLTLKEYGSLKEACLECNVTTGSAYSNIRHNRPNSLFKYI